MEEAANRMEICRVSQSWVKQSWNAGVVKPTIAYSIQIQLSERTNVWADSHRCCSSVATFWASCFHLTTRISCQQTCTVLWPKKSTMQATSRRWASRLSRLGLLLDGNTNILPVCWKPACVCVCLPQLIEVQAEYHRKSLELLQSVLPQIKAHQGEFESSVHVSHCDSSHQMNHQ